MNDPYRPPQPPAAGYAQSPYAATPGAGVSDVAIDMLRQTRPWVLFMGVMCFVGAGLMLLMSLFMFIGSAFASSATKTPFPMGVLALVYLPFAFIYIYPGLKLWSYGSAIGRLVASRSPVELDAALAQQKSFWKYCGIVTIVVIVGYILLFIGLIIAGAAGALNMMQSAASTDRRGRRTSVCGPARAPAAQRGESEVRH